MKVFAKSSNTSSAIFFENLDDESVKGFWCDGVLLSEADKSYSQKFVNDNRQIKLKAFVGKDGQVLYNLTLKFGKKALSRFARNLDIVECIPLAEVQDWVSIDSSKKEIEIQLL